MVKRRKEPGAKGEFVHESSRTKKRPEDLPARIPEAPRVHAEGVLSPEARHFENVQWLTQYSKEYEGIAEVGDQPEGVVKVENLAVEEVVHIDDIFDRLSVLGAFRMGARVIDGDWYGTHYDDLEAPTHSMPIKYRSEMELGRFLQNQYGQDIKIASPDVAGLNYAVAICKALQGFTPRSASIVKDMKRHFDGTGIRTILFPGTVFKLSHQIEGILGLQVTKSSRTTTFKLVFHPYFAYIEKGTAILYFDKKTAP